MTDVENEINLLINRLSVSCISNVNNLVKTQPTTNVHLIPAALGVPGSVTLGTIHVGCSARSQAGQNCHTSSANVCSLIKFTTVM